MEPEKKSRLSDEDIASIRRIYQKMDVTQKYLAEIFHTTQPNISRLVRGLRRRVRVAE